MFGMTTNESPPISAEQLAALPPEFRGLLQSIIDHYERRCDELRREVAELKAELQSMRKTPLNSSVPPSTEHPHAKSAGVAGATETPDSKKQKKKRGGQQGHPKRERELVPVRCSRQLVVPQGHAVEQAFLRR